MSNPQHYVIPHTLRIFNALPGSAVGKGLGLTNALLVVGMASVLSLYLMIPFISMFGGAFLERGIALFLF